MSNSSSEAAPAAPATGSRGPHLPYLPGLDGLRAIAVIAVLLYHADVIGLPGGFLGVEVFFVISGYLITALLLAEWDLNGDRIDLKGFWLRRARRLLPALFLLLVVVLAFCVVFLPDEVAGLRSDVAAATVYVTNWYLILTNKSYFEAVGRPSLLRHLWSLAVEEQFYVFWPMIFFGAMRWLKRRRYVLAAVLAGAAVSSALMAALFVPDVDPSRVYYGTDTRAAGLLIGAALAFVWTPGKDTDLGAWSLRPRGRQIDGWILEGVGAAALVGLGAFFARVDEFQPFLYQGGFALLALTTAVLIAATVHPRARWLPRVLGWEPLRYIGLRSYGIYLWHWPIFMVTRPQLDVAIEGVPLLIVRWALTLVVAELSFRFVETPLRQGALERAWRAWREAQGVQREQLRRRWTALSAALLVFITALGGSVVNAQPPAPPPYLRVESINTLAESQPVPAALSPAGVAVVTPGATAYVIGPEPLRKERWLFAPLASHAPQTYMPQVGTAPQAEGVAFPTVVPTPSPLPPISSENDQGEYDLMRAERRHGPEPTATVMAVPPAPPVAATDTPQPPAQSEATATPDEGESIMITPVPTAEGTPSSAPWTAGHISCIGDSVMLGAAAQLQKTIVDVDIDARVGRQVSEAIALLQQRKAAGTLGPVVVLHVGNNGTFSAKQFDEIMAILSETRRVIFLDIKIPRKWEAPNNAVLADGVKRYPNTVLIDWRAASSAHPDYFWGDGMHLRPEGAQVYADMIAAAAKAP